MHGKWYGTHISRVISPPGIASLKEVFDGMKGTQGDINSL